MRLSAWREAVPLATGAKLEPRAPSHSKCKSVQCERLCRRGLKAWMCAMLKLQPVLLYTRDFCGRQLRWHIVHDPCDPQKAPDVLFDDHTFCPLVEHVDEGHTQLVELLGSWDSLTDGAVLPALIKLLLTLYTEHQRRRIAALEDDRILFELAMVGELGCREMLLSASPDSSVQQACFAIPLHADLTPAQQLIQHLTPSSTPPGQQQQQQFDPSDSTTLDEPQQPQGFMLQVAFKVGPGITSHTAPDLQLQSPAWFRDFLPQLSLPSWDPQTSLLEYVPHLTERLDKHLQDSCPAATLRFELVNSLAGVLGLPVEVNMHSSGGGRPGTSSGLSSSGAAAAGRGRYSSVAVFQVMFEQQVLLLFVELGPSFPADAPVLALQNTRRQGPDSYTTLANIPWSPRWPADEMTARLFNFVKQQAATVAKESSAPSAAASPVPGAVY